MLGGSDWSGAEVDVGVGIGVGDGVGDAVEAGTAGAAEFSGDALGLAGVDVRPVGAGVGSEPVVGVCVEAVSGVADTFVGEANLPASPPVAASGFGHALSHFLPAASRQAHNFAKLGLLELHGSQLSPGSTVSLHSQPAGSPVVLTDFGLGGVSAETLPPDPTIPAATSAIHKQAHFARTARRDGRGPEWII